MRNNSVYYDSSLYGHCKDGVLVYFKPKKIFIDTYWGIQKNGVSDQYSYSYRFEYIKNVHGFSNLRYLCNLDDVVEITRYKVPYYNPVNVYTIPEHHGYRKKFFVDMGVGYDIRTIENNLNNDIYKIQSDIECLNKRLHMKEEYLAKVRSGEIEESNLISVSLDCED